MKLGLFLALAMIAQDGPNSIRLPVTRDTWFSNVGSEADANVGGSPRLKLKSIQEMALIDVDPAPLRGRTVRSALLHVRSVGEPRLKRVTVGSFGADWFEGTAPSYAPQAGSSTHNHKRHPDIPWTVPGSDLCSVILGQGGTAWRMAEAGLPDAEGWQTIAVDPSIVAARVAGVSQGFLLFDDTGTEWSRQGETFVRDGYPNRFVASRDSNRASAPYMTVEVGPEDKAPPRTPGELRVDEPVDRARRRGLGLLDHSRRPGGEWNRRLRRDLRRGRFAAIPRPAGEEARRSGDDEARRQRPGWHATFDRAGGRWRGQSGASG